MITMHVKLPSEMENYIKDKVTIGAYRNSTEVIREAIGRMQAEDRRLSTWQPTMAKVDAQFDQGNGASTPELVKHIKQLATHQVFQLAD
jgi:antitoxin ParD1/3/4